jgi:TRAP-type C4-dicarboxylate transport system permease small subunit
VCYTHTHTLVCFFLFFYFLFWKGGQYITHNRRGPSTHLTNIINSTHSLSSPVFSSLFLMFYVV